MAVRYEQPSEELSARVRADIKASSPEDLAKRMGVSHMTVVRVGAGARVQRLTLTYVTRYYAEHDQAEV